MVSWVTAQTTQRTTPVIVGILANAESMSAGAGHTCALVASGAAKCWGSNATGELGDGTTTERHTPGAVIGFP
jgi:alpha-tubulin suppressor-like RCC1 family protein